MTHEELDAALKRLGLSRAAFARKVSQLSGLAMHPSGISRMCSGGQNGRKPSALVVAVVRLMLEQRQAQRLAAAAIKAGWSPDNGGT